MSIRLKIFSENKNFLYCSWHPRYNWEMSIPAEETLAMFIPADSHYIDAPSIDYIATLEALVAYMNTRADAPVVEASRDIKQRLVSLVFRISHALGVRPHVSSNIMITPRVFIEVIKSIKPTTRFDAYMERS